MESKTQSLTDSTVRLQIEEDDTCLGIDTTPHQDDVAYRKMYVQIEHLPWWPPVNYLSEVFKNHGHEIRVVGGAVRDIILKKTPKDIDLCTTAAPAEMIAILKDNEIRHRETGIQHGTVTVYKKGHEFEVTSLRKDAVIDGNRVCLYGRSFKEDAERRDLTINAMSLEVDGQLHDFFSGREHLTQGKLRFVVDAEVRVAEDPLRILRYFRFSSSGLYDGECPEEYRILFTKQRSCLADPSLVAGERIWKEMGRVLASDKCCDILDAMKRCKILRSLWFPVIEAPLDRLINCRYKVEGVDQDTRAAALLGLIFKGRPDQLTDLCNRWKVSNKVREVAMCAVNISGLRDLDSVKQHLYYLLPSARFKEEKIIFCQVHVTLIIFQSI